MYYFIYIGIGDMWDSKGPHGGNATTFLMGAFVGSVARNEAGKLTRARQQGGSTNGLTGQSLCKSRAGGLQRSAKKAWLFAKLQPGRARKRINAT